MSKTQEQMRPKLRGQWKDDITLLDPVTGEAVKEIPGHWRPNQIQDNSAIVVAAGLRRAGEVTSMNALSFMAVGEGQASWDTVPPAQPKADTTLDTEVFRKAIAAADMVFVDALGGSVVTGPTRFIRVVVVFGQSEANGTLREFGMFGGDATVTLDSGQIFNWVVTSRVDKDTNMIITRTVDVEVTTPP